MKFTKRNYISIIVGCCALILAGCQSWLFHKPPAWDGPRIFSIGRSPILTFSTNKDLEIPIEGMELADSLDHVVSVTLSATKSITEKDYEFDHEALTRPNRDVAKVVLKASYLKDVQTHDTLDLAVHVYQADAALSILADVRSTLQQTNLPTSAELSRILAKARYVADERLTNGMSSSKLLVAVHKALDDCEDATKEYETNRIQTQFSNKSLARQQSFLSDKEEQLYRKKDELDKKRSELNSSIQDIINKLQPFINVTNLHESVSNLVTTLKERPYQVARSDYGSLRDALWSDGDKGKEIIAKLDRYAKEADELKRIEFAIKANEEAIAAYEQEITKIATEIKGRQEEEETFAIEYHERLNSLLKTLEAVFFHLAKGGNSDLKEHKTSTASRTFTFYKTDEYRQNYHAKRVSPENIMAFPEPEDEAVKLFGKKIAEHYFVVRLSVRNTDSTSDRLVSTGMVRARGRAIVEVQRKKENILGRRENLRFTVPVEVAPHSAQQVYAVLTDESVKEPRAVVFRTLDLAGAIASAYTLTFDPSQTTKSAVQLATGVGIPAFSKWWTDRLPGYQRNIVNFAMDDLVKVPKGGVTSHKFLFFPKDKIEAMIIDQYSYSAFKKELGSGVFDRVGDPNLAFTTGRLNSKLPQPNTFVAYLSFDNLDVPFENVFQPEPTSPRQRVLDMVADMKQQIRYRQDISDKWLDTNRTDFLFAGILNKQQLVATNSLGSTNFSAFNIASLVSNASDTWQTNLQWQAGNLSATNVTQMLTNLNALIDLLRPQTASDSDLIHELASLRQIEPELEEMQRAILGGSPADKYSARLDEMQKTVDEAKVFYLFYAKAAQILVDGKVRSDIEKFEISPPSNQQAAEDAFKKLKDRLSELETARNGYKDKLLPNYNFSN